MLHVRRLILSTCRIGAVSEGVLLANQPIAQEKRMSRNRNPWFSLGYLLGVALVILLIILLVVLIVRLV
jgi:hypothetical protein